MEVAISKYLGIRKHVIVPNISWGLPGMHECDIFAVKKTGYCIEIEIKRSKSDLLADFKKNHDHSDKRIKEFYYALPENLLKTCEELIPKHAGIIVCRRSEWGEKKVYANSHRNCTPNKGSRKLTAEEQLKVASLGCMRIWSLKEKIIKMSKK